MKSAAKIALAARLKTKRVRKPLRVINAALDANIKVCTALAMLEMENSIPQQNIFGCDWGAGKAFCHQEVTLAKVLSLRNSQYSNGIGWTQITYKPLVTEFGGSWSLMHTPEEQMKVGFRYLRSLFDQYGDIRSTFRSYNGSGPDAEAYADRAVGLRSKWAGVTGGR